MSNTSIETSVETSVETNTDNEIELVIGKDSTSFEETESLCHIRINEEMKEALHELIEEEKQTIARLAEMFNDKKCAEINNAIKDKKNCYSLDNLGLLIRQQSYNKPHDPFGWKFDDEFKPIHYWRSFDLSDEENVNSVLTKQKINKPDLFNEKGLLTKIYSKYYPERLKFIVKK